MAVSKEEKKTEAGKLEDFTLDEKQDICPCDWLVADQLTAYHYCFPDEVFTDLTIYIFDFKYFKFHF